MLMFPFNIVADNAAARQELLTHAGAYICIRYICIDHTRASSKSLIFAASNDGHVMHPCVMKEHVICVLHEFVLPCFEAYVCVSACVRVCGMCLYMHMHASGYCLYMHIHAICMHASG